MSKGPFAANQIAGRFDAVTATEVTVLVPGQPEPLASWAGLAVFVDDGSGQEPGLDSSVPLPYTTASDRLGIGTPSSLIVGAIGITNVTLVTVTERIGEIGLRRALGAGRRHIAAQFLVESGTVGLVGGIIGTSKGIVAVVVISAINDWTPMPPPAPSRRSAGRHLSGWRGSQRHRELAGSDRTTYLLQDQRGGSRV